jgi:cytochrome c
MPNKNGFEPNIDGPNTLAGVRAYYANEKNFGGQKVQANKRCMKDCQKDTAKVVHIKNGGISEFNPPMSIVKDLPAKEEKAIDVKAVYANACAMCHDGFLSPASPEWAGYTKKGMDKVYANGINGKGGMPAKGGADLSDKDFKTIVDYLVSGKIK